MKNKKAQGMDFLSSNFGKIILALVFLAIIIFIIVVWSGDSFKKILQSLKLS